MMFSVDERISTVWEQMGGRGLVSDLSAHVLSTLDQDEVDDLVRRGLSTRISAFLRRRDESGLPMAPEIDEHHTHAQLELLDLGEWKYVVRQYMKSSRQMRQQAQKAADRCFDQHGYLIDIDVPETWLDDQEPETWAGTA